MTAARSLLVGVLLAGVLGFAFFHFVVSPRLSERSDLDGRISQKQTELTQAQALLADNVAARADVRRTAAARVRLGTAAPPEEQTGALVTTLTAIADRAGAHFTGIDLAATADTSTTGSAGDDESASDTASTGLASQSITITMTGRYAAIQKALRLMRALVRTDNGHVRVAGRLIAVDGVTLTLPDTEGETGLGASISARTFTSKGSGTTSASTSTADPSGGAEEQGSTTSSSSSSGSSASTTTTNIR